MARTTSAWIFCTIAGGVPAGATRPIQLDISSIGRPEASDKSFSSGSIGSARLLSLASGRNCPLLISGRLGAMPSTMKSTLPVSRPCTTSELPL